MAVYRCEVKTLNRSSGRSAVAAAAYRAAERLRADPNGQHQPDAKVHDYRRRGPGVAHAEILTPEQAPAWAHERARLWNEAERAENRRNSVTAREILLSLPHELDDAQRIELTRGFAARLVERYGVAVDLAIHRPDRKGDERNHHAHLMMTTRRFDREGFTEKTRELDDMKKRGPQEIEAIRELWEREQNLALERTGREERVSRLSNEAQGVARIPEPKLGEAVTAKLRRGEETTLAKRWRQVRDTNAREQNARRVQAQRDREFREEQHAAKSAMRLAMEARANAQKAERRAAPRPGNPGHPTQQKPANAPRPGQTTRAFEAARDAARPPNAPPRDTAEVRRAGQTARAWNEQAQPPAGVPPVAPPSPAREPAQDAARAWQQREEQEREAKRQREEQEREARRQERLRNEQLRAERQRREQALQNEQDPGREIPRPGSSQK